jgi:NTE family protein
MGDTTDEGKGELALVMSGGGARAAYQIGFLDAVADRRPDLGVDIITGVSAGAINAAVLGCHEGSFRARITPLVELWSALEVGDVLETRASSLTAIAWRWGLKLLSGGRFRPQRLRGLVDTAPLEALLRRVLMEEGPGPAGLQRNLDSGLLKALAVTATSYTTGQSITFVQGRDIVDWERPNRRSRQCGLCIEHILASASLPMLFPAVQLEDGWYGDGGIRLTAPLAPAVHLGASRILAVTTRYGRSNAEADAPMIDAYPPPAQVAGVLLSAIFLDLLDADGMRMERINRFLAQLPEEQWLGLRPVALKICRPSRDLGLFANEFEARMPRGLRFLVRGAGSRETRSNDFLSLVMFQPDYTTGLIELGRSDAEAQMDSILAFLDGEDRATSGDTGALA